MFGPMIGPMGRRQRIWAVLAALAAANSLSASVISQPAARFGISIRYTATRA